MLLPLLSTNTVPWRKPVFERTTRSSSESIVGMRRSADCLARAIWRNLVLVFVIMATLVVAMKIDFDGSEHFGRNGGEP